jgi:PiT family inorganic phosphate transporter
MSDLALPGSIEPAASTSSDGRPNLDKGFNPLTMIFFFGVMAAGLLFVAYSIYADVDATGAKVTTYLPFLLLFVALLIALGFEFVNGFHDTANAVATVIYTHSMLAEFAVVWSGFSFSRRVDLVRRRCLRHRVAASVTCAPPRCFRRSRSISS